MGRNFLGDQQNVTMRDKEAKIEDIQWGSLEKLNLRYGRPQRKNNPANKTLNNYSQHNGKSKVITDQLMLNNLMEEPSTKCIYTHN